MGSAGTKSLFLCDVCTSITDGSHNPPVGVQDSAYRMLSSKNVYDDNITLEDPRYITKSQFCVEDRRTQISPGDVLFTIVGTVGRAAVVPDDFPRICLQRSVAVLKPNTKLIASRFLMYQLFAMRPYFEDQARGVAQRGIYLKQLSAFALRYLPPLPAQRRIAATLDRICELKKNAETRLAKLDLIVKSRFVEMFGDMRINSQEWAVSSLGDMILHANNGLSRRGSDENGNIVLRIVELRDGYIDYTCPNRIRLTEKEGKRYLLEDGDFLFVRVNGNPVNVGRCAFFRAIEEPVYHNDHIIRVRFNKEIDPQYLSHILNGSYGKDQIRSKVKTSAGQYTISQDGLGEIVIPVPPLAIQREFAAFVEKVEKLKEIAKRSAEQMDVLYRSKLQEYFG